MSRCALPARWPALPPQSLHVATITCSALRPTSCDQVSELGAKIPGRSRYKGAPTSPPWPFPDPNHSASVVAILPVQPIVCMSCASNLSSECCCSICTFKGTRGGRLIRRRTRAREGSCLGIVSLPLTYETHSAPPLHAHPLLAPFGHETTRHGLSASC